MPKFAAALLAACALTGTAHAAEPAPVWTTVIADLYDGIYNARAGRGGVDATGMAVEDFGESVLGRPVVLDALNDHNKPAEAPGLAAQACDAGADLLMDVQNSPIAVAVSKAATQRHKLAISTGLAVPTLTLGACSKHVYHYPLDSVSIEAATAAYVASLDEARGLHPDVVAVFNAGADADREAAAVVEAGPPAQVAMALLYLSDVDRVGDGYAGVRAAMP